MSKIIEYKVLNNGEAVLLTRQPALIDGELIFTFTKVPVGVTAIFASADLTLYRELEDGKCSVLSDLLCGTVSVTLAILDGSARPHKWVCEGIIFDKLNNGYTLIYPDDANLPQRVADLKLENDKIRETQDQLEKKLKLLDEKLVNILEGYDLV